MTSPSLAQRNVWGESGAAATAKPASRLMTSNRLPMNDDPPVSAALDAEAAPTQTRRRASARRPSPSCVRAISAEGGGAGNESSAPGVLGNADDSSGARRQDVIGAGREERGISSEDKGERRRRRPPAPSATWRRAARSGSSPSNPSECRA